VNHPQDKPDGVRLQKVIAQAGVASRRASELIIADGRVTVNGRIVTDPARDVHDELTVKVDGKRVKTSSQTLVVYLMYVAVALVYFGLFHTKWGLRLRAVGEHPQAADTVGIKVNRTRFWNVALAGAIAGLGGTFFTIGSGIAFNKEMTAGAGFIALAAVIFGQWDPIKATLAALLFGFASNLQNTLSVIGSPVPSEFMLMLPYVVTIFAVAGLVGKVRGPAAAGKPYIKS
jgi:ABC-type uncharacterized transport system permease subunit